MKCKLCRKFYKDFPLVENKELSKGSPKTKMWHSFGHGSFSAPIKCAFDNKDKIFSLNNWGCRTMIYLRYEFVGSEIYCENTTCKSIAFEEGFLLLNWYKSRGRTQNAVIQDLNGKIRELDLKTAEMLVQKDMLRAKQKGAE